MLQKHYKFFNFWTVRVRRELIKLKFKVSGIETWKFNSISWFSILHLTVTRAQKELKLKKIMQPISKCSIAFVQRFPCNFSKSRPLLYSKVKCKRICSCEAVTKFKMQYSFSVLGRHSDNLMTSRMTFCSKNIETVPLFYCNFDSISFCVLTTSVLIRDCNFKTTSTFLSVVSFKVYSTKISSSQEYDDKYVWDCDQSSLMKFSEFFWMKFFQNVENFYFIVMIRVILAPNDLLTPFNLRAQNFRVNVEFSTQHRGQKNFANNVRKWPFFEPKGQFRTFFRKKNFVHDVKWKIPRWPWNLESLGQKGSRGHLERE